MRILVIDGANVVGSLPDGSWRDRPGAARRLAEALEAARLPYDEVVLVLEVKRGAGAPRGRSKGSVSSMPMATVTTPSSPR